MAAKKKEVPQPNYLMEISAMKKDDDIGRVGLEDAKEFHSLKDLPEITYGKNGKCITITKFDPNEIKKQGTRKSRGTKHGS